MINISLENQVAIIVGAGRGIGRSTALRLAEAGADVVVTDLDKDLVEETRALVEQKGRSSLAYTVDVKDEREVNAMIDGAVAKLGRLDIMVNNAGINLIKLFTESTSEEFNKLLDVNLKGVYYGCKAALRHMIPQKSGRIVNTASQAAKAPFDFHSMYSASKFGVVGMTQVIAREVGKYNVNINCICPGIVRTNMWEQNLKEYVDYNSDISKETYWEKAVEKIPTKRPQEPEDMANAILFLCSDLSSSITGQALNINGGQVCN